MVVFYVYMEYVKYQKATKYKFVIQLLIDQILHQPYFGNFPDYITLSAFQTPPTPKVTSGASTITCYTKYSPPAQHAG